MTAPKPVAVPVEWATNQVDETVERNGQQILVTNKVQPSLEFQGDGLKYRENLSRQYINYALDNFSQWINFLSGNSGGLGGTTAQRPTAIPAGVYPNYLDTDLGIPIWWDGTQWVNSGGVAV